jgi:YHYH protein
MNRSGKGQNVIKNWPSGLRACALLGLALAGSFPAAYSDDAKPVATQFSPETLRKLFNDNVRLTFTDDFVIVESDGIPNHKTANYPNADNPNRILKQNYHFRIPLHPRFADKPTRTPFGPIGVAVNGIPFYNQYNAEGGDAVRLEVFDSCCGHPDPMGRYHYHKYPVCVKSPFKDEPGKHSPLIGFMFDGLAVYGPNGDDGKPPNDLDDCNGHADIERGYHYHVTAAYPYLIGAYRGVVERSNLDRPPGGGPPRGPRRGGPPRGGPFATDPN